MTKSAVRTRTEVRKLQGNTRSLLEDFRMARREAGNRLRKDLAQARSGVKSDVKQMLNRFQKARLNSVAEINKVRTASPKSASTKHIGSQAVETPLKSEAPAAEEQPPDLETRMLSAISGHPEGINLAGAAKDLGMAPIVLGKTSKSLLAKRKIRKEGKLYFPVNGKEEAGQGFHIRPPVR